MFINERSRGLIEDFQDKIFHILGCGAIGSSASTQLCRMGADKFVLYDLDSVEIQNIGVSHYVWKDIGKNKVEALKRHLKAINPDVDITVEPGRFSAFVKPLSEDDITEANGEFARTLRDLSSSWLPTQQECISQS